MLRAGPRYYRADLGKVSMPGGRTGVMIGLYDVDEEVRHELAFRRELEARLALQEKLLEQEKRRKEQDAMITAMASDYRSVYHVDLDRNDAVCYRADDETAKSTPVGEHFPYLERFTAYCENCVDAEYKEGFLQFIDPEHIREALATEAIIAYRYLARAHGREYYEMLRMAGVRRPGDRDDHMVHAVGVGFTEIDAEMRESLSRSRALREALAAAQQASRAKTAFLSSMSHEIRTPMNAIIGLNHIALSEPDLPEKVAGYLHKMDESAEQLLGIINDILDMSRIESGRMVIRNEEFSFSEMLEQVNAIIGEQCREKGLSYECRTSGRIDERYTGDDEKLSQVLINILGNSVKFTPEGGSVSFLIEEGPRFGGEATLRFTVRDTGIGMSKEFLPRIFDPFSQEDSSTTSRYGSTGLGMPITKSIVELMNGSISVESEKGAGSTFTVTVTLGEAACGDGAQTPDGSGGRQGRTVLEGRRVLLAEDVPINAEITVMVLGMREIEADVAENGRAALETFLSHPEGYYDAILMDMRMPEMDGLEATRAIRACGRADAGTIPIIALTANAFDEDVQRSLQAGLNAHLSKPVEADALFEALERLIPGEGVSK